MKKAWVILLALGFGPVLCRAQENYRLEATNSIIQIHLDTAGALGFAGHPHLIETPIEQGTFVYYPQAAGKSSVELVVDAGALRVMDPKVSAKDRKEIQATMQSDRVLGVKRYPKIVFKSLAIEPLDRTRWQITGNLTIRNETHPVTVLATLEQIGSRVKATGRSQFKQSTFGIKPVAAGLGTVRVRDKMAISFVVFGQPKSAQSP